MTTFAYRGFDSSGRPSSGLIEAADQKSAREQLALRGVLAESLATGAAEGGGFLHSVSSLASASERAVLYHELAALLRAGMPLAQALALLMASSGKSAGRQTLAAVQDAIKEGSTLAGAMAAALPRLLPYETPMLEAGERAAALEDILERLACFMEEQLRLREQIIAALAYPSFVALTAIAIAIGTLAFAFPRIAAMLQDGRADAMPLFTRVVMAAGKLLLPVLCAVPIAAAAFMAWLRLPAAASLRMGIDRAIFAWPVTGRARRLLASIRFSRTLALLLHGGVPVTQATVLAGKATGSKWLATETEQAAIAIEHGEPLATAIKRAPPLAAELGHWIEVGEASGSLPGMLAQAGERLQQTWQRHSTRLLALIEPALILTVGFFVLIMVTAILLPILALNAMPR